LYGPGVRLSTVGERVFGTVARRKPAQVLGDPDQRHTYTVIGDFARALAVLGERDEALGEVWQVPSAPTSPPGNSSN
jgi:nucleoside-diphosphate-sugar epimerase